MRLGKCMAKNFGSYQSLFFDFNNLGLSLIQGPTGAGKSTLFDLPAWCLFGITSKNGGVDEVRSWNCPDVTSVSLDVTTKDGVRIVVCRIRGLSKDNDLCWMEGDKIVRGKDIKETQKLLNQRLGVDGRLYQYAAYYSEFSPSSIFFMTNPKNRKMLLESLTDLSFPIRFQELAKSQLKDIKEQVSAQESLVSRLDNKLVMLNSAILDTENGAKEWKAKQEKFEQEKAEQLTKLHEEWSHFENRRLEKIQECKQSVILDQESLKALHTEPCKECGRTGPESEKADILNKKISKVNTLLMQLQHDTNPYDVKIGILETKEALGEYPLANRLEALYSQGQDLGDELSLASTKLTQLLERHQDLSTLNVVSDDMKVKLLEASITNIRDLMNHYLQTYFEGEFIVGLLLEDADDLNVTIMKNGNLCSYTQLSKGQRGLLKFTFAMAVMKVSANNVGIMFDNIFLDEALDGLDTDLKVKAVGMLQEIASEHASVMIIDHSTELKNTIDSRITVKLVGDRSELES